MYEYTAVIWPILLMIALENYLQSGEGIYMRKCQHLARQNRTVMLLVVTTYVNSENMDEGKRNISTCMVCAGMDY